MKLIFAQGCLIKGIINENVKKMLNAGASVRCECIEEATVYIIEVDCAMKIEYADGTVGYLADYLPH